MDSVQQPLDSHSRDGTTEANQVPGKLGVPQLEVCVGVGGAFQPSSASESLGNALKLPCLGPA